VGCKTCFVGAAELGDDSTCPSLAGLSCSSAKCLDGRCNCVGNWSRLCRSLYSPIGHIIPHTILYRYQTQHTRESTVVSQQNRAYELIASNPFSRQRDENIVFEIMGKNTPADSSTVERAQSRDSSRSPGPGLHEERRKPKTKNSRSPKSSRKPKASSRELKSKDEDLKGNKRQSNNTKKVSRKVERIRLRKDSDDDENPGSSNSSESECEKTTALTASSDEASGPRAVSRATKAAKKSTNTPESPADGNVSGRGRKIKFLPKPKKKDSIKTQSEHSTSSLSANTDDTAGFQVTSVSGNISTREMQQRFHKDFPTEPMPSDTILGQLYRDEKTASYERTERFKKENPGERVPSDEVLKKLYKVRTEDDPSSPVVQHAPATPMPLRREQLTRQDSDLSFSTEASWEHYGASADSEDTTAMIAVQEEEDEDDEEEETESIEFDEDSRNAWAEPKFHKSLYLTFTQAFPQSPPKRRNSTNNSEAVVESGKAEKQRSSIDWLEAPSDHQVEKVKSDENEFQNEFQDAKLELLNMVSPHVAKEDNAVNAFNESFNSLNSVDEAKDGKKQIGDEAEWAAFPAAKQKKEADTWDAFGEKNEHKREGGKESDKSERRSGRTSGNEKSSNGKSKSKGGKSKSHESSSKSKSRDKTLRKKLQNDHDSTEDVDLVQTPARSERMSRRSVDMNSTGLVRSKSHDKPTRKMPKDQSFDNNSNEDADFIKPKERPQHTSRRTLDMNSSGQLRPKSRDKSTRKKSKDPEFDSFHEDTMFKSNESSQRQSRRPLDIDKPVQDTNEPMRGLRRSKSDSVSKPQKGAPTRGVGRSTSGNINSRSPDKSKERRFELETLDEETQPFGSFGGDFFLTEAHETGWDEGMGDNGPAAPIIQSSKRGLRRARSMDRLKNRVASEDEVLASGQRRMYKSGGPTTPKENATAATFPVAKPNQRTSDGKRHGS
jgi:hypothetical protein